MRADYLACDECHAVFHENEARYETVENVHWWLDDKPVERWTVVYCPFCGCEGPVDVSYCDNCGEPFHPDDLNDGLCKECEKIENRSV